MVSCGVVMGYGEIGWDRDGIEWDMAESWIGEEQSGICVRWGGVEWDLGVIVWDRVRFGGIGSERVRSGGIE